MEFFVISLLNGISYGLLLFMLSSGLTLIFSMMGVLNFAHASAYMLGAYFAYTAYTVTGSYLAGILVSLLGVALVGAVFEMTIVRRIYREEALLQILVCYAFILIFDDLVRIGWGPEFVSMGMPEAFQLPPFLVFGGVVPPFYGFLMAMALAVAAGLAVTMHRTRYGKIVRALAHNPVTVSTLGIPVRAVYVCVFALGALLAGGAGALAAPVRSLTNGMGFGILIESFIVTVIGGMGSIPGALIAALLIGLIRSFGSVGFPLFTEGLVFAMMIVILLLRPQGLLGRREREI